MNIYEKLLAIQAELGVVEKALKVQTGKGSYKAVSERDVIDAVKPLEAKYKVYSYPSKRTIVDQQILSQETQNGTRNSLYLRVETEYTFVNIEEPSEKVTITTYGDGIDTGDKATGKAMTYADKYALMKAYKISTGDDPDKDASPENGYTAFTMDDRKVSDLMLLAKTKGVHVSQLLKKYHVQGLPELTQAQYTECYNGLSAMQDKPIESAAGQWEVQA